MISNCSIIYLNITNKQLCTQRNVIYSFINLNTSPSSYPKIPKLNKKVIFFKHFVFNQMFYTLPPQVITSKIIKEKN